MRKKIIGLVLGIGLIFGLIASPAFAVAPGDVYVNPDGAPIPFINYDTNLPNAWTAVWNISPGSTYDRENNTDLVVTSGITETIVDSLRGDSVSIYWYDDRAGGVRWYYAGTGEDDTTDFNEKFVRNTVVKDFPCIGDC